MIVTDKANELTFQECIIAQMTADGRWMPGDPKACNRKPAICQSEGLGASFRVCGNRQNRLKYAWPV